MDKNKGVWFKKSEDNSNSDNTSSTLRSIANELGSADPHESAFTGNDKKLPYWYKSIAIIGYNVLFFLEAMKWVGIIAVYPFRKSFMKVENFTLTIGIFGTLGYGNIIQTILIGLGIGIGVLGYLDTYLYQFFSIEILTQVNLIVVFWAAAPVLTLIYYTIRITPAILVFLPEHSTGVKINSVACFTIANFTVFCMLALLQAVVSIFSGMLTFNLLNHMSNYWGSINFLFKMAHASDMIIFIINVIVLGFAVTMANSVIILNKWFVSHKIRMVYLFMIYAIVICLSSTITYGVNVTTWQ